VRCVEVGCRAVLARVTRRSGSANLQCPRSVFTRRRGTSNEPGVRRIRGAHRLRHLDLCLGERQVRVGGGLQLQTVRRGESHRVHEGFFQRHRAGADEFLALAERGFTRSSSVTPNTAVWGHQMAAEVRNAQRDEPRRYQSPSHTPILPPAACKTQRSTQRVGLRPLWVVKPKSSRPRTAIAGEYVTRRPASLGRMACEKN